MTCLRVRSEYIKLLTWKIFAYLLPILSVVFDQLTQEKVVFLFPTLFGVIFQSPVAAVAHFGVPAGH